jgi:hypothetical protein
MGTWNGTCGVTQMPICEGEEAVMIPLAIPTPNHFQRDTILGAGASDNTLIAQPFSYPVFGRYEGGGDVATGEKELGKTSLGRPSTRKPCTSTSFAANCCSQ